MEHEENMTNNAEREKEYTVIEFGTLGFGNKDAAISFEKQKNKELFEQMNAKAVEIIKGGYAMVRITEGDDGCFDGRGTNGLVTGFVDGKPEVRPIDKPNHERPMVAGGGYTTGTAIAIAVGDKAETVEETITQTGVKMESNGVVCGAHTAAAHSEGDCGCGALDRMKSILGNAVDVFAQPIKDTSKQIIEGIGLTFDGQKYDEAMSQWGSVLEDEKFFKGSTGVSRSQAIVSMQDAINESAEDKLVAVTKDLEGSHNEWFLTINTVEGMTFSQAQFRALMMHWFPGVDAKLLPQVFPLDAPRLLDLAKGAAEPDKLTTGLQASVAYQVSTAAELTDGTLPIYVIK